MGENNVVFQVKWHEFSGQANARLELRIPKHIKIPTTLSTVSGMVHSDYLESDA